MLVGPRRMAGPDVGRGCSILSQCSAYRAERAGNGRLVCGPIAVALMSRAEEVLEEMPTVRQPDVIADKLPG
jgi:hypothetical protein